MLRIVSMAAAAGFVPAALGAISGPPLAHPAAKISTAAVRIAVSRHYGGPANASGYSVILMSGQDRAWVFGGTNPGGSSTPVAARWNSSSLTPSALPAGLTGFISDAGAASGRAVWAASEYGRYLVRWNGQRWSLVRRWQHGTITGLTVAGRRSLWVFSTTAAGVHQNGTWHFNGLSWTHLPGLAGRIYRASAISGRDIWAVAADRGSDVILRFSGSKWRRVRTGVALAGVQAHDILAVSDHSVWVVGNQTGKSGAGRLVLLHWNGRTWVTLASTVDAWAGRLATDWHGGVVMTATPAGAAAAAGLILRASARGWTSMTTIRSAQGSGVSDIAVPSSGRFVLIAGGVLTKLGGDAAIWVGRPVQPAARPDADDD
jgi:hypothetical protein